MNEKPTNRYSAQDIEKLVYREAPSQIPTIVTRKSFHHALDHASTEGHLWRCTKTGAKMNAYMLRMRVFSAETDEYIETVPVAHIYCSACDEKPKVAAGDAILDTALQTVFL